MDVSQHVAKIYVAHTELAPADFVAIFHRWIQSARIEHALLIDVADYSHVHDGPGVLLVAEQGYWGMDRGERRLGMQYRQRHGQPATAASGAAAALCQALGACALLEEDMAGKIEFAVDEVLVGFDDRLRAPNDAATLAALQPDLMAVAARLFGGPEVTVSQAGSPGGCFRARLSGAASGSVNELLARLV